MSAVVTTIPVDGVPSVKADFRANWTTIKAELEVIESAMTPAQILAALLTVDGPASGLNADLFDGQDATAFLQPNLNAQTINPGTPTPVVGVRTYGAADSGKTFNVTTADTQTIPAGLGAGWTVDIWNSTASSVTIDGPGGTNVTLTAGQVGNVKYLTTTLIRVAKGDSTVIS